MPKFVSKNGELLGIFWHCNKPSDFIFLFTGVDILVNTSTCLHMDGASPQQKFTAFITPPGLPREILLFKTENVHAMGTRPAYVIWDLAHLLKTAFGGPGLKTV